MTQPTTRFCLAKWRCPLLLLCLCLCLTGCQQQVDVAQDLDVQSADEIQSVLIQNHITATRTVTQEGMTLLVNESDLPRAMSALHAAGLPRPKLTTLGEEFQPNGMVSTPLSERARYLYALSQELQNTLLQVDGVVVARVHVVLPQRVDPGDPLNPSSAAVFIKYRPGTNMQVAGPKIVQLVADSIPGLADAAPNKISLVAMQAQSPTDTSSLNPPTPSLLWPYLVIVLGIALATGTFACWLLLARNSPKPAKYRGLKTLPRTLESTAEPSMELNHVKH